MRLRGYCCRTAVLAVLLLSPTWLEAEVVRLPPVLPPSEQYPGQMVSHADPAAEIGAVTEQLGDCPDFRAAKMGLSPSEMGKLFCYDSSLPPLAELARQENPDRPPDARDGVFQKLIFDATWLDSGGSNGFGVAELELKSVLAFPIPSRRWPVTVRPGFAVHYLDGPAVSDLPPRVYDAAVQFRWWRRLTPRFGVDLAVAPGVCSDFEQSTDEALRIPGHATGVFDWTPKAKILLGVAYLDREDVNVLPVGGLIWCPREDLKLELAVPRPRIARRIYWPGAWTGDVEDWAYVAGEFGGGTWAIRRVDGTNDLFTYRDYRLILGLERKSIGGLDARLEVGYVFSREIEYASSTPDVGPSDTVMLRAGLTY